MKRKYISFEVFVEKFKCFSCGYGLSEVINLRKGKSIKYCKCNGILRQIKYPHVSISKTSDDDFVVKIMLSGSRYFFITDKEYCSFIDTSVYRPIRFRGIPRYLIGSIEDFNSGIEKMQMLNAYS